MNPLNFDQDTLKAAAFKVDASGATIADVDDALQEINLDLLKNTDGSKYTKSQCVQMAKRHAWSILNRSPGWIYGTRRNRIKPTSYEGMLERGGDIGADHDFGEALMDVKEVCKCLDMYDRLFLRLYYFEDMTFRDIGDLYRRYSSAWGTYRHKSIMKKIRVYLQRRNINGMDRDADAMHDRAVG